MLQKPPARLGKGFAHSDHLGEALCCLVLLSSLAWKMEHTRLGQARGQAFLRLCGFMPTVRRNETSWAYVRNYDLMRKVDLALDKRGNAMLLRVCYLRWMWNFCACGERRSRTLYPVMLA
jgi:hypothetical protein